MAQQNIVFSNIDFALCSSTVIILLCSLQGLSALSDFKPVVIYNASTNHNYTNTVNNTKELIYVFPDDKFRTQPPRITVSANATLGSPLLVVVSQPHTILSWQTPLAFEGPNGIFTFTTVSRTLCPESRDERNGFGEVVVTISTRSDGNVNFTLFVNKTQHFDIVPSEVHDVNLSPAEPQFFRYRFAEGVDSALLHVESADESCMTLSVQDLTCPVYDLENTVQYSGLWQTVISKGGIFLRREEFPNGLFVVLVMQSTSKACTNNNSPSESNKQLRFQLERSIGYWDYVVAVASVVGTFTVVYLVAGCLVLFSKRKTPDQLLESPESGLPPTIYHVGSSCATTPTTPLLPGCKGLSDDESDLDETDVDFMYEADTSKEVVRAKAILFLSDLAQKDPRVLSVKSKLYLWNMATVAVFYALPVVQLVFTNQQTLFQSGNQDLCYYNFLCSHRLGVISDFNHVFSNIGYLLFGLLFLGLTYRRQKLCHSVGRHLGIPYHYGMFYALGVALCMEGVLSACYHLCPNHSNFQFDTSFMYILCVLSMMKIYQTRHPDISASAYTVFGALALIIFLGTFGVFNGQPWFYVVFTVLHLLTCLIVTAQIYHVGSWRLDLGMFVRFFNMCRTDYSSGGFRQCLTPMYPARMFLLFLANVGNWGLVGMGYYLHLGDFATYMLSLFLANVLMYFIFYIVMKLVYKERILWPPMIYIILSCLFWVTALYFFYHKSISWKKTPAESRAYNQHCQLLDFYDKHDIWHMLSAGALFFSFMVLLTLDDDIAEKDRRIIAVF